MRRLAIGVLALSAWGAMPGAARAADVSVRLQVEPAATVPRQPVRATVTVTGALRSVQVELPTPPGVTAQAAGSARNVQIINGAVASSQQYFFQIVAAQPGSYSLGPAVVTHGGTRSTSNQATLTVSAAPRQSSDRTGVFVEAAVSDARPYVGEQVIYTLQLYRPRTQALREFRLVEPDTEGLWAEQIDADTQRVTVVDSRPYIMHTVRRAYFPTRAGPATIGAAAVTYQELLPRGRRARRSVFDDSVFDMLNPRSVARRVDVAPVDLDVQPLPEPPAGVNPTEVGVGTFSVSASLSDNTIRVGESLTLTVRVEGTGNLRSLPDVHVPESNAFKVYPDVAEVQVRAQGPHIRGTREQRVALVPQREGDLTIPPLALTTFDPAAGDWKVLTTPAYTVRVEPGESQVPLLLATEDGPRAPAAATTPTRLAVDLLAPHPLPARLRFAGTRDRVLATTATTGAPLLFVASWVLRRRSAAHAADPTLYRRRRAGKAARAALKGHTTAPDVATAIMAYVADRIGAPEGSITGEEAIAIIRIADAKVAAAAATLIRAGEAARYGGAAPTSAGRPQRALTVLKALDRLPLQPEAAHA